MAKRRNCSDQFQAKGRLKRGAATRRSKRSPRSIRASKTKVSPGKVSGGGGCRCGGMRRQACRPPDGIGDQGAIRQAWEADGRARVFSARAQAMSPAKKNEMSPPDPRRCVEASKAAGHSLLPPGRSGLLQRRWSCGRRWIASFPNACSLAAARWPPLWAERGSWWAVTRDDA